MAVSVVRSLRHQEPAVTLVCAAARSLLDHAQAANCLCLASCLVAGAIEMWTELLPGTRRAHDDTVAARLWRLERQATPLIRTLAEIATQRAGTAVAALAVTRKSAWIVDDMLLLTTPASFQSTQRNATIYQLAQSSTNPVQENWRELISGIAAGRH